MLQGLFSLIVGGAAIYISAYSSAQTAALGGGMLLTDYLGFSVFGAGLFIESISDWQLDRHIANPDPNKGKFCKTGLWSYTRHPNYFGENLAWWGLYIVACSLPRGYLTIFAPAMITWLLTSLSGVPLLEKKQSKHPEWEAYASVTTSSYVPWFQSKPKSQ